MLWFYFRNCFDNILDYLFYLFLCLILDLWKRFQEKIFTTALNHPYFFNGFSRQSRGQLFKWEWMVWIDRKAIREYVIPHYICMRVYRRLPMLFFHEFLVFDYICRYLFHIYIHTALFGRILSIRLYQCLCEVNSCRKIWFRMRFFDPVKSTKTRIKSLLYL